MDATIFILTTPRGHVFFTRDFFLARNFLSSPNSAEGAAAQNAPVAIRNFTVQV
jgi:hypothetical protein